MKQLTREEALAFHDSRAWEKLTPRERAIFQIDQDRLCMPFSEFHKAIEEALGRPVWTHEFGLNRDGLRAELAGEKDAPTFEQILGLLPANKTLVITTP